jgi:hypothetical protein
LFEKAELRNNRINFFKPSHFVCFIKLKIGKYSFITFLQIIEMQTIFTNDTFSIEYDETRSLAVQRWYGDMSEEAYKAGLLIWLDFILNNPPIRYNIVYPNLSFVITIELQDWTNKNISSISTSKGIEKAAIIVPQAVLDQIVVEFLAIEQIMDDTKAAFETRYFTSEVEALQWFGL